MLSGEISVCIRHIQADAVIIFRIGPCTPRFRIAFPQGKTAVGCVLRVAPEIEIVAEGKAVLRPRLCTVVPCKAVKVGDGIERGKFLMGGRMRPAGEVDKPVVHADVIRRHGVGVLHVARGDLTVKRPVLRLGFDIDGRFVHHNVDDAAVVLVFVAALHGIVPPVRIVERSGGVFPVRSGAVVGLLDQPPGVRLIDQIFQTGHRIPFVGNIADTAAPHQADADPEAVVFEITGIAAVDRIIFRCQFMQGKLRIVSAAGAEGQSGEVDPLLSGKIISGQAGKRDVFSCFKEKLIRTVLSFFGISDAAPERFTGSIRHGEAVEGFRVGSFRKINGAGLFDVERLHFCFFSFRRFGPGRRHVRRLRFTVSAGRKREYGQQNRQDNPPQNPFLHGKAAPFRQCA